MSADNAKRIVEENINLVYSFMSRYPVDGVDHDDYESDLMLSLWKSAQKFDPAKGFAFSTYAFGGFEFIWYKHLRKVRNIPKHHQLIVDSGVEPFRNLRIDNSTEWDDDDILEVKREIEKLPVRDKSIIGKFLSGKSQSQISREIKSSRQWVSRVYMDGVARLKARMVNNG